uniref:Conserved oligomeric Golgi complex subunit 7 n=1 Tax=Globodera rostochiensis TaxID=31243 RepID=A0A914GXK3_GLORO
MPITIDKTSQLGSSVDTLNKRLQEHLRMLRQNESSAKQPNAVLEYDMAKRKVDKLAELLRAKLLWLNTCQELQLLDASDGAMRYQKLVSLQQSFEIMQNYSLGDEKSKAFEKLKDEFLSWYSSATILAIDTGDVKHLDSIKEKYYSLDRIKVFESNFGNYAKNKIKSFIEDESKENTLWSILQEFFAIWKRTHKLTDSFIQEDGSEVISKYLFDGLLSKWEVIVAIVSDLVSSSETPFVAAKSLGKVLADFSDFVQKEGDEHIMAVFSQIMQRVFSVFSDDYGKYATSVLLCVVNKITAPEKGSRHRHKFNWLLPFLEEIQSEMRDIVKQSAITFGAEFSSKIVPSFEHGLRELNSLLQNHDILNIKPEGIDIRTRKSIQENTEDKVSAICVMGYLLNIIDNVNEYISETTIDVGGVSGESLRLISNASLLETLNLRVVGRKIESIANTITLTMEEEMHKLKQLEAEASEAMSLDEQLSRSLPSFSVAPHNYVTGVGHGLLSQMSTIGGYSNDRNFVRSISAAASDINSSSFNDDEADLWLLTEVAKLVQNVFCAQVGNVSQLSIKLRRQFNADILFLMEALADLRLQPTTQMSKLAEKLRESS